jgi:hypothetical protein
MKRQKVPPFSKLLSEILGKSKTNILFGQVKGERGEAKRQRGGALLLSTVLAFFVAATLSLIAFSITSTTNTTQEGSTNRDIVMNWSKDNVAYIQSMNWQCVGFSLGTPGVEATDLEGKITAQYKDSEACDKKVIPNQTIYLDGTGRQVDDGNKGERYTVQTYISWVYPQLGYDLDVSWEHTPGTKRITEHIIWGENNEHELVVSSDYFSPLSQTLPQDI